MELCGRKIGGREPLFFILGPCVIEGLEHALNMAEALAGIADRTGALIIYKSSFDKANRTSGDSFRGLGMHEGLAILERIKPLTGLPTLTDVHAVDQVEYARDSVDVLQIPALLSRQTDLVQAAAATGLPVNIKKGQFMAPRDMQHVARKAHAAQPTAAGLPDLHASPIMLCERGSTFGYNNLVVDMRGLEIMAETGCPIVFDATHSVQLPGAGDGRSGGERRFVPLLARAAVAAGVAGVFMEAHQDPDNAPCDGPNAWPLDRLETLIRELQSIDTLVKSRDLEH